jgi:hypothetical protein
MQTPARFHSTATKQPGDAQNEVGTQSKADGFQKNRCKLCLEGGSMAYRLRKGLGQVDYSDYMAACVGTPANCFPGDDVCVANAQNLVVACEQGYDHENPPESLPAPMQPGSAAYNTALAQAGGSVQEVDQSVGEVLNPAVWSQPGATITAMSSAPPASKPATVTQSSAPPSSTPGIVTQSSAPPASSGAIVTQSSAPPSGSAPPASSSSFDLSSIPWWGWLAAAGVAFMALKK